MLDLYERNKDQLGFLPFSAFEPFRQRNEILVAHEDGNVLGYVLFRRSTPNKTVRITHLCVDEAHRGKGVALKLIDELMQRFSDFIRITARCRTDFDSWHFWKNKSGFDEGQQIVGRKKAGSLLTEFYWEPNELPLFRSTATPQLPIVVIDANVFFDLYQPDRSRHEEATGLLEDWLSGELDLCVTTELREDAIRSGDAAEIQRVEEWLADWTVLKSEEAEISNRRVEMERIFGPPENPRDESDHRHLAIAIANGATAFVTRDGELINRSDELFANFGMSIYRPSEIILEIDVLQDNARYQYRELEKSGLRGQRFSGDCEIDFSQFRSHDCERIAPIRARWNDAIANPRANDVRTIVGNDGRVLAIAIASKDEDAGVLTIELLRIRLTDVGTRFGSTLIRYLVGKTKQLFGAAKITRFTDDVPYFTDAFVEFGWFPVRNWWTKISICNVLAPDDFAQQLEELRSSNVLPQDIFERINDQLEEALSHCNARTILRFEEQFSPLKLNVPFIRNYIVPIRPRWAKDLFDPELGPRELWSAPIDQILNPRSVYYKAPGGFNSEVDCARIIWYVSEDGKFVLAKHLRSCSIMTKRVTGCANDLFKRYRRLGIYEYMHVRDIPPQHGGMCEAIEFCETEILENPISYSAAIEYLDANGIVTNNFVTAQEISNNIFLHFYQTAVSRLE